MKNCLKYIFLLTVLFTIIKCNSFYKAGNLHSLDYPVESNLRVSIIRKYIDTIIRNGYEIPEKWKQFDKLVDLDSIDNKRIYFKNTPEEMYLISFNGILLISDIYNEKIKTGGYISKRENISNSEEERIKKRLQNEILQPIEIMVKRKGFSDSVIFNN